MDGPYGLTVILDSGKQNPYVTQYRGALPKPYRKEETGETVYLGFMQYWISGDCMNMGIVELGKNGGLQVQYPVAASLRSGYIGGGFQHFGFDVYTDCSMEDFMMLQTTTKSIDEKRAHEQYHSTFYSGMEFGNYSVLLRGYVPLGEESGQFTVNYLSEEAEGAENKDYTEGGETVSADVLYELFEIPEPVPFIEPFDFTDTASGNIRSINDVQPDESGISVSNGSGISYMQCLRAAEYAYGENSEDSFIVTPCDEDKDGWNELYLYIGFIENESIPGIVVREDGTREDVLLYAFKYSPGGLEFHGEFAASLFSYPWYFQEYRDAETAAKEIYLMLTNPVID